VTFAKRTDWNTAPNALTQALERIKPSPDFIDLTVSNPTLCGFRYLEPSLLQEFKNPQNLLYQPDAHGLLEARLSICAYYARRGAAISPDQIFITANTSEAYTFVFKLLADAGDQVLAPAPGYPLIEYLAGLNDLKLERYPLCDNGGWSTDLNALAGLMTAETKALMLVHPANPTGNYVAAEERAALVDLCARFSAPLISDEVFFDYAWNPQVRPDSFASNNRTLTFTLSGISKILGLPQMKLSWIIVTGPETLRREACRRLEIISDTYLSAGTPNQNALPFWFSREETICGEIRSRVRENRTMLEKSLGTHTRVNLSKGAGGWTSVLELPEDKQDEAWALHFLEEFHTALHPGYLFDLPAEKSYLVVSLLVPPDRMHKGLGRLKLGLG